MIEIDGKRYPTISDASRQLKVSVKTINQWIERRVVDQPPSVTQGLRSVRIFPPEYVEEIRRKVQARLRKRLEAKKSRKKR